MLKCLQTAKLSLKCQENYYYYYYTLFTAVALLRYKNKDTGKSHCNTVVLVLSTNYKRTKSNSLFLGGFEFFKDFFEFF
jgi:hypothetical protein